MSKSAMDIVAVLASGGLDSSVLIADLARESVVQPIYVRMGLAWEEDELRALGGFIETLGDPNVRPPVILAIPVESVYSGHWSVTGEGVPDAESADAAVFLPGRNVLLVGLAAVFCSLRGIPSIALAVLEGNPFPDASPDFFEGYTRVLARGLEREIRILTPYRGLNKADLIRAHRGLPLERTLTCLAPRRGSPDAIHCGACNKCRERRRAFERAGVPDRTRYSTGGN